MISIEPRIVGVIVGLLVAYAFCWDYRKYKALDRRIETLIKSVEKYHRTKEKANESAKETVSSEQRIS